VVFWEAFMLRSILLIGLMLAAGGCSSGAGGDLRVTRLKDGRVLAQGFQQAYIAQSEHGDYDVVLIADTAGQQAERLRGNILAPSKNVPVRHIVHVRVFWRPLRGLRSEDTATSNAAVDWYVITPGAREGEDLLRYRGSGLVAVYPGHTAASITLRNVRLRPETVRGQMTDPLGRAAVSGALRATWDDQFVRNMLSEVRSLASETASAR
jgi:hypothetical protein